MKTSIQERMDTTLERVRKYNTLFNMAVETVESQLNCESIQNGGNAYYCTSNISNEYQYNIICSDTDRNTIEVSFDHIYDDNIDRIGELLISLIPMAGDNQIIERYYNTPLETRDELYKVFTAVYDTFDTYFNPSNTN